jgi:hypothetical protein
MLRPCLFKLVGGSGTTILFMQHHICSIIPALSTLSSTLNTFMVHLNQVTLNFMEMLMSKRKSVQLQRRKSLLLSPPGEEGEEDLEDQKEVEEESLLILEEGGLREEALIKEGGLREDALIKQFHQEEGKGLYRVGCWTKSDSFLVQFFFY